MPALVRSGGVARVTRRGTQVFTISPVQHDGWTIHLVPLEGHGEVLEPCTRTAWVDPTTTSLEVAAAHVVAHLDLRHHLICGDCFTAEQCDEADRYADKLLAVSTWNLLVA